MGKGEGRAALPLPTREWPTVYFIYNRISFRTRASLYPSPPPVRKKEGVSGVAAVEDPPVWCLPDAFPMEMPCSVSKRDQEAGVTVTDSRYQGGNVPFPYPRVYSSILLPKF